MKKNKKKIYDVEKEKNFNVEDYLKDDVLFKDEEDIFNVDDLFAKTNKIEVVEEEMEKEEIKEQKLDNIQDPINFDATMSLDTKEIIDEIDERVEESGEVPTYVESIAEEDTNVVTYEVEEPSYIDEYVSPEETVADRTNDNETFMDDHSYEDYLKDIRVEKEEEKKDDKNIPGGVYVGLKSRIAGNLVIPCLSLILLAMFLYLGLNRNVTETISFTENSTANYSVCLKDNEYYESSCVGEDQEYLSLITKDITADLSYSAVYSEELNAEVKYFVNADVYIYRKEDGKKVLYNKKFELVTPTSYVVNKNVISLAESVVIPYEEYNNLVNTFLTKFGIDSVAEADVSLYVDNNGSVKKVATLIVPLAGQTYNIQKNVLNSVTSIDHKKKNLDEISVILYIVATTFGIIFLISGTHLVKTILKYSVKKTPYEKELSRILKEYDKVIVESKSNYLDTTGKQVHTVKTFLELVDVRDTVEKPIVYMKVNSVKTIFYVLDKDIVYIYMMKESRFN